MRQFGLIQTIPDVPPSLEGCHNKDLRGKDNNTNWHYQHRPWVDMWDQRHTHILHGTPLADYHPTPQYWSWYVAQYPPRSLSQIDQQVSPSPSPPPSPPLSPPIVQAPQSPHHIVDHDPMQHIDPWAQTQQMQPTTPWFQTQQMQPFNPWEQTYQMQTIDPWAARDPRERSWCSHSSEGPSFEPSNAAQRFIGSWGGATCVDEVGQSSNYNTLDLNQLPPEQDEGVYRPHIESPFEQPLSPIYQWQMDSADIWAMNSLAFMGGGGVGGYEGGGRQGVGVEGGEGGVGGVGEGQDVGVGVIDEGGIGGGDEDVGSRRGVESGYMLRTNPQPPNPYSPSPIYRQQKAKGKEKLHKGG